MAPPSGHILTYLSRVSPPGDVLGPDGLLDAVHFLLVAFAVLNGRLFGGSQGVLQSLHPLGCGPQTLFQLGQLTAKVCIVPHQLEDTEGHVLKGRTGPTLIPAPLIYQCVFL